jgi:hypothetical protein
MESLEDAGGVMDLWEDKNIFNFMGCKLADVFSMDAMPENPTEWEEFSYALHNIHKYTNCFIDIPYHNFMFRGKQVVVTDPIV